MNKRKSEPRRFYDSLKSLKLTKCTSFAWKTTQPWSSGKSCFPIQILLILSGRCNRYFRAVPGKILFSKRIVFMFTETDCGNFFQITGRRSTLSQSALELVMTRMEPSTSQRVASSIRLNWFISTGQFYVQNMFYRPIGDATIQITGTRHCLP